MLIDVHSHLDDKSFDTDLKRVLENARRENIRVVTSCVNPDFFEKSLRIVKNNGVFLTLGLTPTILNPETLQLTTGLIEKNKNEIVGIGEVGLDYYWIKDNKKREKQKENFVRFIELSKKLDLPLVVHSRDAEHDVIKILKENEKPALLHCFSGSLEQANDAISFGCLLSIPTSVVNSKQKQELVKKIPLDHIVLETDSPWLSPKPKTRNEPANLKFAAKKIAELTETDFQTVSKRTTSNAADFFNLNSKDLSQ